MILLMEVGREIDAAGQALLKCMSLSLNDVAIFFSHHADARGREMNS